MPIEQGVGQGGKEREKDGGRKKINIIEAGLPPVCPLMSAQWEARTAAAERIEDKGTIKPMEGQPIVC